VVVFVSFLAGMMRRRIQIIRVVEFMVSAGAVMVRSVKKTPTFRMKGALGTLLHGYF
jgi:hypothetical protein